MATISIFGVLALLLGSIVWLPFFFALFAKIENPPQKIKTQYVISQSDNNTSRQKAL